MLTSCNLRYSMRLFIPFFFVVPSTHPHSTPLSMYFYPWFIVWLAMFFLSFSFVLFHNHLLLFIFRVIGWNVWFLFAVRHVRFVLTCLVLFSCSAIWHWHFLLQRTTKKCNTTLPPPPPPPLLSNLNNNNNKNEIKGVGWHGQHGRRCSMDDGYDDNQSDARHRWWSRQEAARSCRRSGGHGIFTLVEKSKTKHERCN